MAAAPQQLSAFELERQERIAANKRKLEELEINEAINHLQQIRPAKRPCTKKPRAQRPTNNTNQPARRSDRNAGKEKPDYACQMPLAVYEERQPRARSLKPDLRGSSKREAKGRYPAWHWGIPDAPDSAVDGALAAAQQRAEQLRQEGTRAYVKGMTHSMVGGGGWLQAPKGMQADYTPGTDVVFTVAEDTHPQTGERFAYTQAKRHEGEQRNDAWNVGFLQKRDKEGVARGGYGFSNNWKGFAVDQFLHPSDFVVFGVTGPRAADMYVFRAWDFATAAQKPEGFDAIRFTPHAAAEGKRTAGEVDRNRSEQSGDAESSQVDEMQGTCAVDHDSIAARNSSRKQTTTAKLNSKRTKSSKQTASATSKSGRRQAMAAATSDGNDKKQQQELVEQVTAAAAARGGKKQTSAAAKQQQQQSQTEATVEQEVFTVDWILGSKVVLEAKQDGTQQEVRMYKVRWLGYDDCWDSWEPAHMFDKPLHRYDWGALQADGTIKPLPQAKIPQEVP